MLNPYVNRRDFLRAGGALVISFPIGAALGGETPARAVSPRPLALDQVDAFLAIGADGRVSCFSGKVDLGTGVRTALAQIVADELDVALDQVEVTQGDTQSTPDQGPTYGSLSIQVGGMQIRQAAASARAALVQAAAAKLSLPAEQLFTRDGAVYARPGGQRVAYGELVGGRQWEMKVDPKAVLKDPADYRVVGQSVPRLDIPAKVSGEFLYIQDLRRPGMVHARVVRPQGIGAKLQGFDDSAARAVKGHIQTVRSGDFLAVVARTEWAAISAARALRVQWSAWEGLPDQARLWEHVRATPMNHSDVLQSVGDLAQASGEGLKTVRATYDFAIHTHGSIGPSCAVAEWVDGKLTCWTASQQTHLLRRQLSLMFAIPPEDLRCIYVDGSGCYGRNGHEDAAADAALVAKLTGLSVRVQWMREDEHGWDPKGPPTLLDFRGSVDAAGKVQAWESTVYAPDAPKTIQVPLVAAGLAGMPTQEAHPGNIVQALAIPYKFANIKVTAHRLASTPFRPSWIRTPGRMQNTFGNETFLDELALAAGADPFEFRIANLDDARAIELLRRLAKVAQWAGRGTPAPGRSRGRGVAFVKYELVRTYVGAVAEVEVDRESGRIRVTRFVVAHDCGQVINPDGLRNQIDGNVIQTVSRTLLEELRFDRSRVTSVDWASYPILTFPDVPEVVVELMDRPREKPWGAGEPTASIVPAAISKAVFDAIGVRLRSVPFVPQKVLAGLRQS